MFPMTKLPNKSYPVTQRQNRKGLNLTLPLTRSVDSTHRESTAALRTTEPSTLNHVDTEPPGACLHRLDPSGEKGGSSGSTIIFFYSSPEMQYWLF